MELNAYVTGVVAIAAIAIFALLASPYIEDNRPSRPIPSPSGDNLRAAAIAINGRFAQLLPNPQMIFVGTVPNDGTGDPMLVAWEKVRMNLDQLTECQAPGCGAGVC